jgi:hypothetical protein
MFNSKKLNSPSNFFRLLIIAIVLYLTCSSTYALNSIGLLLHHSRNADFEIELNQNLHKSSDLFLIINKNLVDEKRFDSFEFGLRKFFNPQKNNWFLNIGFDSKELKHSRRTMVGFGYRQVLNVEQTIFLQLNYNMNIINVSKNLQFDPRFKLFLGYKFK